MSISEMDDAGLLRRYVSSVIDLNTHMRTADGRYEIAALEYEILRRMAHSDVSEKVSVDSS